MRKTFAVFALAAGIGLVGSPAMAQDAGTTGAPSAPTTQTQDGPEIQPRGATCYNNCAGQVYANIVQKSSNQSFTYKVGFQGASGVNNARMQVRMLNQWGGVVAEDNHFSPAGYRYSDSRQVGRSYVAPVASVCHTLWESGVQIATACAPV